MSTFPVVGSVMRERIFSNVDLPAPLRPITPTTSPGATSKLTSFKAQTVLFSLFPFLRNKPKGLRNVSVIESRSVGLEDCLAPIRYLLLKFSTRIIDLIIHQ